MLKLSDQRAEGVILTNLIINQKFANKVLSHLKKSYFLDKVDKVIYEHIEAYYIKYKTAPTLEALVIDIEAKQINPELLKSVISSLESLDYNSKNPYSWLIDITEEFCRVRSYEIAVEKSAMTEKKSSKEIITILMDDLSKSSLIDFNLSTGHDYTKSYEDRWEYYTKEENKLPFKVQVFNKITRNGVRNKSLNILMAGTNVGKTLFLSHFAADNLKIGKNVVYFTLEIEEKQIAKRIDANLLDIDIDEFDYIERDTYINKFTKLCANNKLGKLVIKEFPASSTDCLTLKSTLNDLREKEGFVPDVIYVDYLTLLNSFRVTKQNDLYGANKSIAEELRDLASEFDVPIMTAVQANRAGQKLTKLEIENVAESHGISNTADLLIGITAPEELVESKLLLVNVLKTRYGDRYANNKFVVGFDTNKMRIYDPDESDKQLVVDYLETRKEKRKKMGIDESEDVSSLDNSPIGQRINSERKDILRIEHEKDSYRISDDRVSYRKRKKTSSKNNNWTF